MMKPILSNTEMVRAILDGRKTVTRRALKPQPPEGVKQLYPSATPHFWRSSGVDVWFAVREPCKIGDILWVRETWSRLETGPYLYKADNEKPLSYLGWRPSIHMPREAARIFLRVTDLRAEKLQDITNDGILSEGVLPRFHEGGCRCSAYEKGCMDEPCNNRDAYNDMCHMIPFMNLWNSTIKPDDRSTCSWEANPWVWVIEFERISGEMEAGKE